MSAEEPTPPTKFNSLELDDLAKEFQPRSPTAPRLSGAQKKTLEKSTAFPSREARSPGKISLHVSISNDVAERLKALLVRDAYTTWTYAQAIEYLLDIEEKHRR
jgi:hypothetical protein